MQKTQHSFAKNVKECRTLHSECIVLLRSLKAQNILLRSFCEFLATYETQKNDAFFCKERKRTQRTQRSFAKERKRTQSLRSFEKKACPLPNPRSFFQYIYI